VKTVRQTL